MSEARPNATRSPEVLLKLPGNALVTAKEAALLARCTEDSLAHDRSRGIGFPFIRIGRRIRYRLSDVLGRHDAALQPAA